MKDKEILEAMRGFGFDVSLDGCCWGATQVAQKELVRGTFKEFDDVVSYLKYQVGSVQELRILVRAVQVHDRKLVLLGKKVRDEDSEAELKTLQDQLDFWINSNELSDKFRQALAGDSLSAEEEMLKRLMGFFSEIYLHQYPDTVKWEVYGVRGGLPKQADSRHWVERAFANTEEKKKENEVDKEQTLTEPLRFVLLTGNKKTFLKNFLHELSSDSASKNMGIVIVNSDHAMHLFYEGGLFWRMTNTFTIMPVPTIWLVNKIMENIFMQNGLGNLGIIIYNDDPGLSEKTKNKLSEICLTAASQFSTASKEVVNQKDHSGAAPLHIAAENGALSVAAELLKNKELDVNLETGKGEGAGEVKGENLVTALMIAAGQGDSAMVSLLLSHKKIDVNAIDKFGCDALYWAIYGGYSETAMILLARDDLELVCWPEGRIPALGVAIDVGLVDVVGKILNDWRVPAEDVHKYEERLLTLFSDLTLDMSGRDEDDMTMLHIIASKFPHEIKLLVELLKRSDIDRTQADIYGNTFLHYLVITGGEGLERALLCTYDDSINMCNERGYSPLACAVYQGNKEAVELLLYHDADPGWELKGDGTTLLDIAVLAGDKGMCDLLRKNGITKQKKMRDNELKEPVSVATNRYSFQDNESKTPATSLNKNEHVKSDKKNRKTL